MVKAFPRVFAKIFGFVPYIGTIIQFLPEFIALAKMIHSQIKKGMTELEVKRDLSRINKAFVLSDRKKAAKELNDVFKK